MPVLPVAAALTCTGGLIDLRERTPTDGPGKQLRALATDPALPGLD